MAAASSRRFTIVFERDSRGRVVIPLPFDPSETWGRKAVHHVTGTVGDRRVRGPLSGEGTGARLVLGVVLHDLLSQSGHRREPSVGAVRTLVIVEVHPGG
jgi:hypothetical protein